MTPYRQTHDEFPAIVRGVIESPGALIDSGICALMESRFGCHFGGVRLHVGQRAAASARSIGAQAYAVGSNIVFGEGRYNPASAEGLSLLAHELSHVVQQGRRLPGNRPIGEAADSLLELEAEYAAGWVVAGRSLPPGFAFGASRPGVIQCHQDQACPGIPIPGGAGPREISMGANQSIELAYKTDPRNEGHANGILVGSDFDRGEIRLPKGAPNQKFGNVLLRRLRGLVHQRRPDIIDFVWRVIYEIKPAGRVTEGAVQLESYYTVTDLIRREYAGFDEPPWKVESATWYPPHVLPLNGDLLGNKIVCTQATDHKLWPGQILYDVRELDDEEKRERRLRRAVSFEVESFDAAFDEFWPGMRNELRRAVPSYDPYNPDYVIIVPEEIYGIRHKLWDAEQMEKRWDMLRVKPSYDFPGGHEVLGARRLLLVATGVAAGVAAVVIVVAGSAVIASAGVAAGAVATTATVAGETTTTAAAVVEGGEVISLNAYRALVTARKVQNLAKAAGVLFVLGAVSNARAASPSVENVSAIRAVAIADFHRIGGLPSASSAPRHSKLGDVGTCGIGFGKDFSMGDRVLFDGLPYKIISQLSFK